MREEEAARCQDILLILMATTREGESDSSGLNMLPPLSGLFLHFPLFCAAAGKRGENKKMAYIGPLAEK